MSSRSHVVVTVVVTQKKITGTVVKAKLHLVDLAGSERVGKTEAQGLTLREAQSINQSLSALGNCMRALTTTATKHVPFRDSKLTHLLRDSLGGNAKTTMCVCLASDAKNEDETMSTLRFGSRAKRIQCCIVSRCWIFHISIYSCTSYTSLYFHIFNTFSQFRAFPVFPYISQVLESKK